MILEVKFQVINKDTSEYVAHPSVFVNCDTYEEAEDIATKEITSHYERSEEGLENLDIEVMDVSEVLRSHGQTVVLLNESES